MFWNILFIVLMTSSKSLTQDCDISDGEKFDCFPEEHSNEEDCIHRGCCWRTVSNYHGDAPLNTPFCYYGKGNFGYTVSSKEETSTGFSLKLTLKGPGGQYDKNINSLIADFKFETTDRLRVKIYDAEKERYEVPISTPDVKNKEINPNYDVVYSDYPFGFAVTRKSNNATIFDTRVGGFIFSDQFLQISSLLPSNNVYGLGEHVLGLKLDTKWTKLSLFARDIATPEGGVNLYGVHPFYLNLVKNGNANGVFLKNSNAMDIILQPTPAITYRTIGGILDFYIFMGPSPNDVIRQYSEVIGKPTMPPYWSLGFHLCKYGYNNIENMQLLRSRMSAHEIPQDVQWNDIDYMEAYRDFTIDGEHFKGLSTFVDHLHDIGMHYIIMTDPAISNTKQNYQPYEDGVQKNVFIKDEDGNVLVGKVWPGLTVFPDFFHPNITEYWYQQIKLFHGQIKFDGMWIDMNEPSNFVQGSTKGCSVNRFDNPPFVPGIIGGYLAGKTICMSSTQAIGKHYDLHSLYGHSEAVQTMKALREVLQRRTLVITRSSYAGTGHHSGHWLGDNHSTWEDLYRSIAGILNFNMFSIPMVGADICGFLGDTTEELCSRWMQLGAFYPFSRNHNSLGQKDQDPAAFGTLLINASKGALEARYTLLPYLYTLMFHSHTKGDAVARPLFFEFPNDAQTYDIDAQFMWGNGLLISPVLKQGVSSIQAYFPEGRWYEYYTGAIIQSHGERIKLPASFEQPNLHIKGGIIIPTQQAAITTTESRKNSFSLIVGLDANNTAYGSLYLDDGDQLLDGCYTTTSLVEFTCSQNSLKVRVIRDGYIPTNKQLAGLLVLGVQVEPKFVTCNGNQQKFNYDSNYKKLSINLLNVSILGNNVVSWSM